MPARKAHPSRRSPERVASASPRSSSAGTPSAARRSRQAGIEPHESAASPADGDLIIETTQTKRERVSPAQVEQAILETLLEDARFVEARGEALARRIPHELVREHLASYAAERERLEALLTESEAA